MFFNTRGLTAGVFLRLYRAVPPVRDAVNITKFQGDVLKMNRTKKMLSVLLSLGLVAGLAGCSGSDAGSDAGAGDSDKPVLLAVSFGSSYNDTRDVTIGAVEAALQDTYTDYEVRRAFTSQIVIDILEDREGMEIDNVTEAMDRLVADGVKEIVVQPTHVMPGFEYDDVVAEVTEYRDQFDSIKIAQPLLSAEADFDALVGVLTAETAAYNTEGTAIVFMGHGTHHEANSTYGTLQQKLVDAGFANYFIGTVEAAPALEDVMAMVEASGAQKVVLLPLMIVAGDHANNDMAGDEEDSWKSAFIAAGYEVECVLKGLGQYAGVQQILIDHAGAAMQQ